MRIMKKTKSSRFLSILLTAALLFSGMTMPVQGASMKDSQEPQLELEEDLIQGAGRETTDNVSNEELKVQGSGSDNQTEELTAVDEETADPSPQADEEIFATVCIEKHTGIKDVLLVEPKVVSLPNTSGSRPTPKKAMIAAYGESSFVQEANGWNYTLKGVKDPDWGDGYLYNGAHGMGSKWYILVDSTEVRDFVSATNPIKDGSVIRFIFSEDGGKDIGLSGGKLAVNKDELIAKLGEIDPTDIIPGAGNPQLEAFKAAKNMVSDLSATQAQVNDMVMQLKAAFDGETLNPATDISITPASQELALNETLEFTANVTPADTTDSFEWSISNPEYAKLEASADNPVAKVTGLKPGTVTLSVKAGNCEAEAEIKVKEVPAEGINIVQETATVNEQKTTQLKVELTPANCTEEVKWSAKNSFVASVDSKGLVKGIKAGKTIITATVGNYSDTCEIEVLPAPGVEFHCDDGRVIQMDENDTITLTAFDQGRFVLTNSAATPDWLCADNEKLPGQGQYQWHDWISPDGVYQPGVEVPKKVQATVRNKDYLADTIRTFYIQNNPTNVEELKVFVGNQEISNELPYTGVGTNPVKITVQAREKGSDTFRYLPKQAWTCRAESTLSGIFNQVNGTFTVFENKNAKFTVLLMENQSVTREFTATSTHVPLQEIVVKTPETFYIDGFSNINGDAYYGIKEGDKPQNYSVAFKPYNASNQNVKWVALTPEIAEFVDVFDIAIVPKKAGVAKFKVVSEENPDIFKEVTINFAFKNPLESASTDASFDMKEGDSKSFTINMVPSNATEQRFHWTYDKEGIVTVKDEVKEDVNNPSAPNVTTHSIKAKAGGTVKVTGTPYDDTKGCKPITFTVNVEGDANPDQPSADYLQMAKDDIQHAMNYLQGTGKSAYGDEWNIFTILRSGGTISTAEQEAYYNSIVEANGDFRKTTDIARVMLALGAMGKDASDVEGVNLCEKLYNSSKIEGDTSNGPIFALIALDSKKYEIPKDAKWSRDKLLEKILSFQTPEGSFGLGDNKSGSVDMTAMALQALAPYKGNAMYPDVQTAISNAVEWLKTAINDEYGYDNSCSSAQVLTALAALKIDPTDKINGFASAKQNLVTDIDSYKTSAGFLWVKDGSGDKEMATQQTGYALEAYRRFAEGEKRLYDLTDSAETPPETPDEDKEAAKKVTDQILALGEITDYEQKADVEAARKAYDGLTKAQKEYVTSETMAVLEAAEEAIKNLTPKKGTVVVSVERFTIGQGYFTEPVKVPFDESDNAATILKKVIGAENFIGQDKYLAGIKNADEGADKVKVPDYIVEMSDNEMNTEIAKDRGNDDAPDLCEFSYSSSSGWMYAVNNVFPEYGITSYVPKDGDVIRFQFTLYGLGRDLSGTGYGDSEASITISDKDELTRTMADANKAELLADPAIRTAYDNAIKAAEAVVTSQKDVDAAEKALREAIENFDNQEPNPNPTPDPDPDPDPDPNPDQKPDPNPDVKAVTLLDKKYGVTLSGEGLTEDMELVVTPIGKDDSDVVLMRKEITSDKGLFRLYNVKLLENGSEINLPEKAVLSIPVGEKYNGKELEVLFCKDSKVTALKGKVTDGFIALEISDVGSFGIVTEVSASQGKDDDNVQGSGTGTNGKGSGVATGDTAPISSLILMLAVSMGICAAAYKKRTEKR